MKVMFCRECEVFGTPKRSARGSNGLANFLKLFFPFNLLHMVWRSLSQYNACRNCGSRDLIPEGEVDDFQLARIVGGKEYVERKLRNGEPLYNPEPEQIQSNQSKEEW